MPKENPSAREAKTTIDSMVELLKMKGRMDLNSVAMALGLASSVVEGWAKVLEAGGIVKITYEVGRMYMESMNLNPEQASELSAKFSAELGAFNARQETQGVSLDNLSSYIKELSTTASNAEGIFSKSAPELQKELSELNRLRAQIDSYKSEIDNLAGGSENTYTQINKKFDDFSAKYNQFMERSASAPLPEVVAGSSLQGAKDSLAALEKVRKDKDQAIEGIKKELDQQVKAVHAALDTASRQINDAIKQSREQLEQQMKSSTEYVQSMHDLIKESKSLESDSQQFMKKLNQDRTQFNDRFARINKEMKYATAVFQDKYTALAARIDEVNTRYGDAGSLSAALAEVKAKSDQAQTEIAALKADLTKIKQETAALMTLKNMSIEKRDSILESLEKKGADIEKRVKDVRKNVSDAGEALDRPSSKKGKGAKSGSSDASGK